MLKQLSPADSDEELEAPEGSLLPFVRRYRLLLTLVVLYLLWRRATASAISSTKPWGPRWLAARGVGR